MVTSERVWKPHTHTHMAFFGITSLGYQDPFQAARIEVKKDRKHSKDKNEKCEERSVTIPALVSQHPYVSHERYQEMRNRHQNLRTPNETQRKPMTSAQQYGWWLPQDSKKTAESAYPWIECQRYPQLNSPMTQFVQQMCLTDKSFSLF
ncbi:hypothetical protein GDO86_004238 [Hymenochirus boettgeri]|uniref:Uncharacterized protein n=1 Tax=Hymenochirus boettgeri TaxID=247094 RepID=A0A8T2K720_9PIPI|nr:hypothetical protein GDO86_004238 [Hymenochirus boettgeri]